tara:strand:+ start:87 stop:521 length:435 start_codon:yes stop_codon:yes gene_type:complete
MPKNTSASARDVRHLRRELRTARSTIRQHALNATTVAERTRKEQEVSRQTILRLHSQNVLARQNVCIWHEMCVEQQGLLRRKQSETRAGVQKNEMRKNPALETADTVIALSQQLCAHCLGTHHIWKIKKKKCLRVECKACKVYK